MIFILLLSCFFGGVYWRIKLSDQDAALEANAEKTWRPKVLEVKKLNTYSDIERLFDSHSDALAREMDERNLLKVMTKIEYANYIEYQHEKKRLCELKGYAGVAVWLPVIACWLLYLN